MLEIIFGHDIDIEINREDLYDKREDLVKMGLTEEEAEKFWQRVNNKVEEEVKAQDKKWSEEVKVGFTNLMIEILIQTEENLSEVPDEITINAENKIEKLPDKITINSENNKK